MALDDFMEFDESNFDPGHITETELTKKFVVTSWSIRCQLSYHVHYQMYVMV